MTHSGRIWNRYRNIHRNRNDYTLTFSNPSEALNTNVITANGADGIDILRQVETLRFDDIDITETTSPTLQSAVTSADGSKLVLTYDEHSPQARLLHPFSVTTDGGANAITAVAISVTVELTLANPVAMIRRSRLLMDPSTSDDTKTYKTAKAMTLHR